MPVEPVDAATPQAILAAESSADPHTLAALAKSSKFSVRYAVVRNHNCPVEVLRTCLDDLEATIHMGIAANPNTPATLLGEIAADEDKLFACHIHLLDNPDTPSDVLERIIYVAHEPKVLMDAARHPNASKQLLNDLIELSGDGNRHVRNAAAGVLALPVLELASKDANDVIRRIQSVNWIEPAGLVAVLNGAIAALDTRTFEIVDDLLDNAHEMAAYGVAPDDILETARILAGLPDSFLVAGYALVAEQVANPVAAAKAAERLARNR